MRCKGPGDWFSRNPSRGVRLARILMRAASRRDRRRVRSGVNHRLTQEAAALCERIHAKLDEENGR